MASSKCLLSTRLALYRVFVSPLEPASSSSPYSLRALSASSRPQFSNQQLPYARIPSQTRNFTNVPKKITGPARKASPNNRVPGTKVSLERLPRDHEITDNMVMVVEADGKLSGPHRTRDILSKIDQSISSLRTIQPKPLNPAQGQPAFAICKIINKKEEFQRQVASQKQQKEAQQARRKQNKVKELELSWAIAPHDMAFKLKQLRTFLEKGHKVDLLIAKKKDGKRVTKDEAETMFTQIQAAIQEVEVAKERKSPSGQPGGLMRIFLEPRSG
jgi:translation initiation factor IF-3